MSAKRKKVRKVVRDGRVAVLYSPGFGAGWSTWNTGADLGYPALLFDPGLVEAVERGASPEELEAIAAKNWPKAYHGGVAQLRVKWLPEGTPFEVHEYDGSESIRERDSQDWTVA